MAKFNPIMLKSENHQPYEKVKKIEFVRNIPDEYYSC